MEHSNELAIAVNGFMHKLEGLECWAAMAGSGTGSMISFKFGDKIPRKRPLSNLKLAPEVRRFDGEFTLFVRGGADWVVKNADQIVCTNNDSNEDGGTMLSGLALLTGRPVLSTNVSETLLEIELNFDGDLSFQMKCRTNGMDGYFLLHREETVAIIGGGNPDSDG